MITAPSISEIYDRMRADFDQKMGNSNWLSRSFALVLIAVFSGAIHIMYKFQINIAKQLVPTLANEEWFQWHARFYGIDRVIATPAKYDYTFTGIDSTVIPAGTEVETESGIVFATDEEVIISSGEAEVGITAAISGTSGNIEVSTLNLVSPISGVDDEGIVGDQTQIAVDTQTLDDWKSALSQRLRNPPSSGSKSDYERWAIQGGAEKVWVYGIEEWTGSAAVGVVVATKALEPVSIGVKTIITEVIESYRPAAASYEVVDPEVSQVKFDLSISPNTTYFQDAVDLALEELFLFQSEPGGTLLLSQIQKSLGNTGLDDFVINDIVVDEVSIGAANIVQSGIGLSRYDESLFSGI